MNSLMNIQIPMAIFRDRSLSVFEIIIEYLKEDLNLTLHDIAALTNRDSRTIWTVYNRAKIKRKTQPRKPISISEVFLPLEVLLNRTYSVLEVITVYLKENRALTYHEIAKLTNRNDRTIWTVYHRAQKKTIKIYK